MRVGPPETTMLENSDYLRTESPLCTRMALHPAKGQAWEYDPEAWGCRAGTHRGWGAAPGQATQWPVQGAQGQLHTECSQAAFLGKEHIAGETRLQEGERGARWLQDNPLRPRS